VPEGITRGKAKMSITLRQLEVFHAVVVSGAISNAKRALGLSQPTISQQLAKLEDILGTQLVQRNRLRDLELTQAGEYWFKVASDVLSRLEAAETQHHSLFGKRQLGLRLGATPSLRGRFTEQAARIALGIKEISRFDLVWGLTSDELVQMITTHKINCGLVSADSVEEHKSSLNIKHLFRDNILWIVPAAIPDDVIAEALETKREPPPDYAALTRHVDVGPGVPWQFRTENWYRSELPFSMPYFGCMTHQAAVDIVAAGIATCHAPSTLLPNLPEQVRRRIKCFMLREHAREAVLVMPKHLLSLRPFAEFQARMAEYFDKEYASVAANTQLPSLPRAGEIAAE